MGAISSAGVLIFSDIDNTLVYHDLEARARGEELPRFDHVPPAPSVYQAFERAHARGHRLVLCTGRALCNIPQMIMDLQPDGLIAEAGSYVRCGSQTLRDASIPLDLLLNMVERLELLGIDTEFEGNDGLIEFYPSGAEGAFPEFPLARTVAEFADIARERPIAKFCIHNASKVPVSDFLPFARESFHVCDLNGDVLEFALPGMDKGSAIRCVRDYLAHGIADTYAFGDSENDLPMADEVETFVAMGNALEGVRARANLVAPHVRDDGFLRCLEQLGLI